VGNQSMELTITGLRSDQAPPELNEQVPFKIKLLRRLPGQGRPDYWLGALLTPLFWLKGDHRIQIEYVVVCARYQGTQIEQSVQHLPIGIAYVTDQSQVTADTRIRSIFAKCQYVAIGSAFWSLLAEVLEEPTVV
jgi:hypothetical protein